MRAIGLMSGTSLDGIDVADVDVRRIGGRIDVRLLHFATTPLGGALRSSLVESLPPNDGSVVSVAELNVAVGEAFASAVLQSASAWKVDLATVDVIGSHGLTLYHAPADGVTMQIGEPAVVAARTGVTCVADFRPADVASGGQGAPLVPFVDRELFASDVEYRAVINIGGIANLTLLPAGGAAESVRAFDCGPGNMVIDECARRATNGAMRWDEDGGIAARGAVDLALLDELCADPYFAQTSPKSTGRERFGAEYARRVWERGLSAGLAPADIVATVTALTARTIAACVPGECRRVILAGGGVHNRALRGMLESNLARSGTGPAIDTSEAFGVPADAKEAISFAVLACEAIAGRVNQLHRCTGARRPSILGKIVPGENFSALMNATWITARI